MASEKEKPSSKGQAWFFTTGLASDIVIQVDDMTFHLHKFPLMSKSLKLHELISEQEKQQPKTASAAKIQNITEQKEKDNNNSNNDDEEEIEEEDDVEELYCHITLPDFPGGSEAFEAAAKFCYGVKTELSPSNVAPLRCAGDFLQMTEEYSEDNLISKTERYLSQTVLRNIKDSIHTLHSCQKLLPLAENLGIVQRCIDAIVSNASSTDPSLFGWPMSEGIVRRAGTNNPNARAGAAVAGADIIWFDDLTLLSLQFLKRLICSMREGDVSADIIEKCLVYYANKYIPGISRANRKSSSSTSSSSSIPSENEQREVLETIIANLPKEKSSRCSSSSSSATTRFLFGLLRTANILNSSEACRSTLEKKIGSQLEQATLDDLLIPSYSYLNETLYDVDCVERILGYFLQGLEERFSASRIEEGGDENGSLRSAALMLVGKLIDGYLSEIAADANLKADRFYQLAISLPDQARLFDDGLYRAVDVYLKAHPWISESEREHICGILDCQKLTLEACTHAAQNERLPLRAVVQVLFSEQLQLRHAIAGTLLAADVPPALETGRQSGLRGGVGEEVVHAGEGGEEGIGSTSTWRAAVTENQVLRLDMDRMRSRVHELERECSTMKKAVEKIDMVGPRSERGGGGGGGSGWRSKFGCKFKTQVCDSHESATVVEARKGRNHRHSCPK